MRWRKAAALVLAAGFSLSLSPAPGSEPIASVHSQLSFPAGVRAAFNDAWVPPVKGELVPGHPLPPAIKDELSKGLLSPNGRWRAAWVPVSGRMPTLWLAASDLSVARLIDEVDTYGEWLWSPRGTLLYWRRIDDSWQEVDPQTGGQKLFLPQILAGEMAGILRLSPDGRRLLFETGLCRCNRGAGKLLPVYVVGTDGADLKLLGVGVKARWEKNKVVIE